MSTPMPRRGTPLTARELQVIAGAARGHTDRRIASTLHCTEESVRGHLDRARARLGVNTRAAAVHACYHVGYLASLTPEPRTLPALSPRQHDVLTALARGYTDSEIARRLYVTPNTVATHTRRLYRALHVETRSHAVAIAWQLGLLTHPERSSA